MYIYQIYQLESKFIDKYNYLLKANKKWSIISQYQNLDEDFMIKYHKKWYSDY